MESDDNGSFPVRGKITKTIGEITFNSNFDSGNLDRVEECHNSSPDVVEFKLWIAPDCAGTGYENGNRSWFYFGISAPASQQGKTIRINIMNMNKQMRLYQQGMTPIIKTVPGRGGWERMRDRSECQMTDEGMMLSFNHYLSESKRTTTYFSFCYPFSYNECQKYLNKLDRIMDQQRPYFNQPEEEIDSVYYQRELLCHSLDGLRIDLLTISSYHGITMETEPRLPGLFPDVYSDRSRVFKDKKVILITSRVHPGETPSSFVFNGFLDFILQQDDPRAKNLRKYFVFKLIPMLNPDGVQKGHYRTDSRGINLNRMYLNPKWELHPSVFAVRSLTIYLNKGIVLPHSDVTNHLPTCECAPLHTGNQDCDSTTSMKSFTTSSVSMTTNYVTNCSHSNLDKVSGVALYVDLHAHATKRGCFIYGNHFTSQEDHVECMLLPKLVSLNSAHFDFDHCVFSERNMYTVDRKDGVSTKEGSGRVALYKATSLIHSYTLECNYNSGRRTNGLSPATMDSGRATPPQQPSPIPHRYTTSNFEEVGRGLALAILDLYQLNPWSRLPTTEYATLNGIRQSLLRIVQNSRSRQETMKKRRVQFKKHFHEGREGEDSDKEENTLSSSPQDKKLPETPPYIITQKATSSRETVILHPHLMFHLSKGKGQDHKKYVHEKKLSHNYTTPLTNVKRLSHHFGPSTSDSFLHKRAHTILPTINNTSNKLISTTPLPVLQMSHSPSFHVVEKGSAMNRWKTNIYNSKQPASSLKLLGGFAVIGHRLTSADLIDRNRVLDSCKPSFGALSVTSLSPDANTGDDLGGKSCMKIPKKIPALRTRKLLFRSNAKSKSKLKPPHPPVTMTSLKQI